VDNSWLGWLRVSRQILEYAFVVGIAGGTSSPDRADFVLGKQNKIGGLKRIEPVVNNS
jgi:hypothetical protein